ncbi:hypothetical protein IQ243_16950 [Nostocales cyanobacterium LEGE 11386]|nr:hypothetical protein [Nostocales cyanobacterium LEGE 11386]
MKDNISLIAAAAGGFMLSVALAGLLRGTPVTTWQQQSRVSSAMVTNLSLAPKKTENSGFLHTKTPKN